MQASATFLAIEAAMRERMDTTIAAMTPLQFRDAAERALGGLPDDATAAWLDNAQDLMLRRREQAVAEDEAEAVLSAVRHLWPEATVSADRGQVTLHRDAVAEPVELAAVREPVLVREPVAIEEGVTDGE